MAKISRPISKGIYLRHRLFEQLDHLCNLPVTWVSAPAGSGKTMLVSSYIEERRFPCLWYQLDSSDGDIATFFYYLGQVAAKAAPRKRRPMPLLTAEYLQGIPTFTLRYFEELYRRLKVPSFLVFDNYQEVPDDSPLHEVVHTALSHIPEGVRVIVISRKEPPPAYIRLQANQQMDILGWEEIRLTKEEAQGMVNLRSKELYTPELMHHIYKLCDGWAGGLVLLSIVVKRDNIAPAIMADYTSEEIYTYFQREIFSHLDQKTQHFFLTTAFLPKMTVRMAEELTGDSTAGDILRYMVHNNFFISRQFPTYPVYEYHPLYRTFLLSRGRETLTHETAAGIQRRAAEILEREGQTEAAVSLLRDIADWEGMVRIIMTNAPEMLKQGRHLPLQEWLDSLPGEVVDGSPWLLYWKGMSLLPISPLAAKSHLEQAFTLFQNAHDPMGAILAASGVVNSIFFVRENFTSLDQWIPIINDLVKKIGTFPNDEVEAWVTAGMMAAVGLRNASPPDMEYWVQRAVTLEETPETINLKVHALFHLFLNFGINKGVPHSSHLLGILQRLSRSRHALPLSVIMVNLTEAVYYALTGCHAELIQAVKKGLELSRKTGIHNLECMLYVQALAGSLDRMDLQETHIWFVAMHPLIDTYPPLERSGYYFYLAREALIRGDVQSAFHYAEMSVDIGSKVGSPIATSFCHLLFAQCLHKKGNNRGAQKHLEQYLPSSSFYDNHMVSTMVLLYEAQFAFERGDESRGLDFLRKSLTRARESGYLLNYIDDPTVTILMCAKALEAGIEVEYVQNIIRRRGLILEKPPIHIENWPWAIKIYTLGRFDLLQDEKPVPSSRKSQQRPLLLLKALIALGGREIGEDRISDLLWPDAEGDMAHHALEMTLHRLRKLLGNPEAISFREGRVTLDERYCWVDAWAFERLLGQADEFKKQGKTDYARGHVEKAITLYRGSFLAGEREEPWMVSPSERLKSKYFKGVWWLGHCLETAGHWDKAVEYYDQCLEVDDCMEEIYRRLMVCYKNLGRRSECLSVYQRCRKTLSSVLGVNPSPETDAIRTSLLSEKKL